MDDEGRPLTEEELAARRSNRRTLLLVAAFVLGLGILPLAAVLVDKFA